MARAMSEEDEKERARDYVERLKVSSLAKAPQHQRAGNGCVLAVPCRDVPCAGEKWSSGLHWLDRDEADALAWSVGEFGKDLNKPSGRLAPSYEHSSGGLLSGQDSFAQSQGRTESGRNEPAQPTTNPP
jgi:hypothetical protein